MYLHFPITFFFIRKYLSFRWSDTLLATPPDPELTHWTLSERRKGRACLPVKGGARKERWWKGTYDDD